MSRLTEEMVIARAKQSDLGLIKKLNCWGSDLSDVSIIKRMRGVEVLALSVNKISSLAAFEDCHKLQELYLRKNNIQDIGEIAYLQNLPHLRNLWLEENPCCETAGPKYRTIVLRYLPNLKLLDNVEVTQEEVENALRGSGPDPDVYEDAYESKQQQQQQQSPIQHQQSQHSYPRHSPPPPQQQQQQQQQQHYQQPPTPTNPPAHQQQQQQQQHHQRRMSSSPMHEPPQLASPLANNSEGSNNTGDSYNNQSLSSKPATPTKEPALPPSPKYNTITKEPRTSFHQFDPQRSPGSDQESSPNVGYRERPVPIHSSISTHSMKEYYQSDRPAYPSQYRHSQIDLTEWDEQHHGPQVHHNPYGSSMQLNHSARRSAGAESYRNGNARENGADWDPEERARSRRPDANSSHSNVLNYYSGCHRRPVNRNSNLLSATLCLVKELDYANLEVLEHAVRCRLDELAAD